MPANEPRRRPDPADIAELLIQLGRLAYSVNGEPGLTATQWMALRYFARANRFSRTVSGFAEYHATTRGTVSQTIKILTERGYLSRIRSESDRRSVRLDLTEQGAAVLEGDPLTQLIGCVEALPTAGQSGLHEHLRQLVADLAEGLRRPRFGPCCACRFLQVTGDDGTAESTARCRFVDADLEPGDLARICVDFSAA